MNGKAQSYDVEDVDELPDTQDYNNNSSVSRLNKPSTFIHRHDSSVLLSPKDQFLQSNSEVPKTHIEAGKLHTYVHR